MHVSVDEGKRATQQFHRKNGRRRAFPAHGEMGGPLGERRERNECFSVTNTAALYTEGVRKGQGKERDCKHLYTDTKRVGFAYNK